MKKNLKLEKQQKAIDYLLQHANPIIRKHAAELCGGEDTPQFSKGWEGIHFSKIILVNDY